MTTVQAKAAEKISRKVMRIVEGEDAGVAMSAITLVLAWLLGCESDDVPIEEIDTAIDQAGEAMKKYARLAREFKE